MANSLGQQYITFTIGPEEYGVDVMLIREIKGWTAVTELPEMPSYVRGVINLRGAIVPIFDLRARFSGQRTEPTARHVVVVLAVQDRLVGVLVDAVADILTVHPDEIRPVPQIEHAAAGFIAGIVAPEGRMVALIDLDMLFDPRQIAAAHQAGGETAGAPAAA